MTTPQSWGTTPVATSAADVESLFAQSTQAGLSTGPEANQFMQGAEVGNDLFAGAVANLGTGDRDGVLDLFNAQSQTMSPEDAEARAAAMRSIVANAPEGIVFSPMGEDDSSVHGGVPTTAAMGIALGYAAHRDRQGPARYAKSDEFKNLMNKGYNTAHHDGLRTKVPQGQSTFDLKNLPKGVTKEEARLFNHLESPSSRGNARLNTQSGGAFNTKVKPTAETRLTRMQNIQAASQKPVTTRGLDALKKERDYVNRARYKHQSFEIKKALQGAKKPIPTGLKSPTTTIAAEETLETLTKHATKEMGYVATKKAAVVGMGKAGTKALVRLGAKAGLAVVGFPVGTIISIGMFLSDPLLTGFLRKQIENVFSNSETPDWETPPSPPRTHFLPLCNDGNRDEAIVAHDQLFVNANADNFAYDPVHNWNPQSDETLNRAPLFSKFFEESANLGSLLESAVESTISVLKNYESEMFIAKLQEARFPFIGSMADSTALYFNPIIDASTEPIVSYSALWAAFQEANYNSRHTVVESDSPRNDWVDWPLGFGANKLSNDDFRSSDPSVTLVQALTRMDNANKLLEAAGSQWQMPPTPRDIFSISGIDQNTADGLANGTVGIGEDGKLFKDADGDGKPDTDTKAGEGGLGSAGGIGSLGGGLGSLGGGFGSLGGGLGSVGGGLGSTGSGLGSSGGGRGSAGGLGSEGSGLKSPGGGLGEGSLGSKLGSTPGLGSASQGLGVGSPTGFGSTGSGAKLPGTSGLGNPSTGPNLPGTGSPTVTSEGGGLKSPSGSLGGLGSGTGDKKDLPGTTPMGTQGSGFKAPNTPETLGTDPKTSKITNPNNTAGLGSDKAGTAVSGSTPSLSSSNLKEPKMSTVASSLGGDPKQAAKPNETTPLATGITGTPNLKSPSTVTSGAGTSNLGSTVKIDTADGKVNTTGITTTLSKGNEGLDPANKNSPLHSARLNHILRDTYMPPEKKATTASTSGKLGTAGSGTNLSAPKFTSTAGEGRGIGTGTPPKSGTGFNFKSGAPSTGGFSSPSAGRGFGAPAGGTGLNFGGSGVGGSFAGGLGGGEHKFEAKLDADGPGPKDDADTKPAGNVDPNDPAANPEAEGGKAREITSITRDGQTYEMGDSKAARMADLLNPGDGSPGMSLREAAAAAGFKVPPVGFDIGTPISPAEIKPGDVVIGDGIEGIYIGDGLCLTADGIKPLSEVAIFSGENQGIFRLDGAMTSEDSLATGQDASAEDDLKNQTGTAVGGQTKSGAPGTGGLGGAGRGIGDNKSSQSTDPYDPKTGSSDNAQDKISVTGTGGTGSLGSKSGLQSPGVARVPLGD